MEYHNISKKEARWDRSVAKFKADLEQLYALGFRPVTMSEYLANKMPLAPGASPVVFTFDDADPSQFKYLRDGRIDPSCAVGIWSAFAELHPDFPIKATWYILPDTLFTQKGFGEKKAKQLLEWGGELANHTMSHPRLHSLSDAAVKKEIGECAIRIEKLGATMPTSFALPYGILPRNTKLLKGFTYKGRKVEITGVVLAGAAPAPSPNDSNRNVYRLPRVQAVDIPFGSKYWLAKMREGAWKPYVAP